MVTDILIITACILIFQFIFWKRLKDDYKANEIFSTSFFILSGIGLGGLLSRLFFSLWWFWFSVVGVAIGLALGIYKYKMKFYESLQASIIGLLPWLVFIFLNHSVGNKSLSSFIAFIVTIIFIGCFYAVEENYKNFSWYLSGRIGLSGLFTGGLFFLTRAIVAVFVPFVLSFVGKFEIIVSGVMAIIFILLAVNLSGKLK